MEEVSCEEVNHPLGNPLTHHIHQTLQNIFKNPDHRVILYYFTENISNVVFIILPRTSHFARSCVELGAFPHPALILAFPVVGTLQYRILDIG